MDRGAWQATVHGVTKNWTMANGETVETMSDFIFLGSKITADGDCSHEIINEYSGLISFRMDWLDLCAVQGTLKSVLQRHSSKASILPCSAFFIVQHSHPYMTTGKTIALTRWTFVGKVTSLLF